MIKSVFGVLLLVSASLAISVSNISNGTTHGTLLKPFLTSQYYTVNYYKIDVPLNTLQVSLNFNNLNDDSSTGCRYLHFYMSNNLPCNPDVLDGGSDEYMCNVLYDPSGGVGGGTNNVTVVYGPEGLSGVEWRVNSSLYIGVTRYYQDNNTCLYQMDVEITPCPTGYIGINSGTAAGNICYPARAAVAGLTFPVFNIPNNSTFFGLLTVPANTAALKGVVNASTNGLNLYGASYGPPNLAGGESACSTTTGTDIGNGMFMYELECLVPRSGLFVFAMTHDLAAFALFNATLRLDIQTCTSPNGGFNCSFNSTAFNPATDSGKAFIVPADGWRYFYYDFPAGANSQWSTTASSNSTGYLWFRQSGYSYQNIYESTHQYGSFSATSNATKYITTEDAYVGGRWFFGVQNTDDAAPASVTLFSTLSSTTPETTQGDSTKDTPTTDADSSSATGLFPLALAAALLALFSTLF